MTGEVKTQKYRVLILTWDKDMAELLRVILTFRQPYEVHHEATSADALAAAEREPPDLIISALNLHEGTRSEHFCARVKAHPVLHAVPVLLYSSASVVHDCRDARSVGADGYLNMPMAPQEILAACARVLAGGTYFP